MLFTYPMVADAQGRLLGVCVMRDLILAPPQARVSEVMLRDVVALPQGIGVEDALDHIKGREIPEYPVCDATGVLRGVVRASKLHELHETTLAAVPGRMVGVAEEERVEHRHPQGDTLPPALADDQSADRLRGRRGRRELPGNGQQGSAARDVPARASPASPATPAPRHWRSWCGPSASTLNRDFFAARRAQGTLARPRARSRDRLPGRRRHLRRRSRRKAIADLPSSRLIGFTATIVSMAISGVSGATVPVLLKRFGTDPAAASSIILTTITDVVSMGSMLLLATLLIAYLSRASLFPVAIPDASSCWTGLWIRASPARRRGIGPSTAAGVWRSPRDRGSLSVDSRGCAPAR